MTSSIMTSSSKMAGAAPDPSASLQELISGSFADQVRAALGPSGLFAENPRRFGLPRFGANPSQIAFAGRVAEAMMAMPEAGKPGEITLIEAGTGTGKTIGYLLPAALAARRGLRIMIATHSNILARQILRKDGPAAIAAATAMTGRTIRIAERIGRRNFVDPDRVAWMMQRLAGRDDAAVAKLAAWREAKPATFHEAQDLGLEIPGGLDQGDLCLRARSSKAASAEFERHVADADDADIVVTNHALVLIDAARWGKVLGGGRPFDIAIFDEADQLPDAAASLQEAKLPLADVLALGESIGAGDLAEISRRLIRKARDTLACGRPVAFNPHSMAGIAASVRDLSGALLAARAGADRLAAEEATDLALEAGEWLDAAANADKTLAAFITPAPTAAFPALKAVRLDPARILSRLWQVRRREDDLPGEAYIRSAVFVSATLSKPGAAGANSFADFARAIGTSTGAGNFSSRRSGMIDPPADFGQLEFVLADRTVPVPTIAEGDEVAQNPGWIEAVVHGIATARHRGGRILVLATSYADAEIFAAKVPGAILHRRGIRLDDLLPEFLEQSSGVLITPAGWAGLDLAGAIAHVVIPRLPFPHPDDLVSKARRAALENRGWSQGYIAGELARLGKARTLRLLRQGIGRAIRGPSDRATIWLLDPRFPLPQAFIEKGRRFRLYQEAASGRADLVGAIPKRFAGTQFARAKILPWKRERIDAAFFLAD